MVAAALLVRWAADPAFGDRLAFLPVAAVLLPLVVLVRTGPVVLAGSLGIAATWFLFVPPRMQIAMAETDDLILGLAFAVALLLAGAASWLTSRAGRREREARERLRRSEERFRGLMEQAPFSIQIFDPDGSTVRANRAWEALWGVDFEELKGYDILRDPQLEAKGIMPYLKRAFAGEPVRIPPIEYDPEETKPGLTRHREPKRFVAAAAYPVKDGAGRVTEVVLIHEDRTDQHRVEEKLRFHAQLLEAVGQAVIATDVDGAILYWNRAAERLYGWTREEALGRRTIDLTVGPDMADQAQDVMDRLRAGEPWTGEFPVRRREGSPLPVIATLTPVFHPDGTLKAIIGVSTDVSELKRATEALEEANRRKDEFLAMLGHELRNPLAAIRMASTLQVTVEDMTRMKAMADIIDRQSAQLGRLIDDLLDVSRITQGRIELVRERLDVVEVVRQSIEAMRSMCDDEGISIVERLPEGPIPADGDPVRLAQVFGNLLHNACKFTARGGEVRVDVGREGDEIVVSVTDTGIGIPAERLPLIFDAFGRAGGDGRAGSGLGIGLTLSRELVALHGGTLEGHSEGEGRGSTFVVRLPRAAPERGAAPSAEDVGSRQASPERGPPPERTARRRVLVVDDNRDALETLATLLRLHGHDVRTAEDGESALDAFTDHRPRVVLLDIGLPGLDGYEVARRIRRATGGRDAYLVAMTGFGQERDKVRASEAGFDTHLTKPAKTDTLLALVAGEPDAPRPEAR